MSTETTHLDLDLIIDGQDEQAARANVSFNRLDALVMGSVIDQDISVPPPTPSDGDRYIVAALELTFVSINVGTKTITVSGNHASRIDAGDKIDIENNSSNDGQYTVVSATDNGGNTDIVISETIPASDTDGNAYHADGAWTGKWRQIAMYYTGWLFAVPDDGFAVKVVDENTWYTWESTFGITGIWVPGFALPVIADDTARDALPARDGLVILKVDEAATYPIQVYDAATGNWRGADGSIV
jgi:hypothetical protein